ncbi:MAG: hydrogenase maturation protease [Planctomycetota bacterium]|nr:hydrogenase maturation protease [Planctomycetota bacterium]
MSEQCVNIVGVGNILMGDDGVGTVALEQLAQQALPEYVRLHDAGLAVSDVLGRLPPAEPLIVIDAVRGDGEPGSVYKLALDDMSGPQAPLHAAVSLHELSVLPALQMEALTGRVFGEVTVFGVEPETIEWGVGLSAPVLGAMDRLVETVLTHAVNCVNIIEESVTT